MIIKAVDRLNVSIMLGTEKVMVGRLALHNQQIWFEYDPKWLNHGIDISPFKLPLKSRPMQCEDRIFDGLFGVFNDSLPDGWGRLLLDRQIRQQGIAPETLTPLDRLAHVGLSGMGALQYEPDYSNHDQANKAVDLDMLSRESQLVLQGTADQVINELLYLNGSSGGARPKILVGVNNDRNMVIHGVHHIPENYQHWLIKFRASTDPEDIGAIEFAYHQMAQAADIEVMPSYLFPAKKNPGFFGTQRFDRCPTSHTSYHMHTASGLLHADHQYPSLDYDNLMRATLLLTKDNRELTKLFRLVCFNILAHNRDDHSKNVAFLMDAKGHWHLAPAYDLTFSHGLAGEHNMMLLGEGKNPTSVHLKKLGNKFALADVDDIIAQVRNVVNRWEYFAKNAGVSSVSQLNIAKKLKMII